MISPARLFYHYVESTLSTAGRVRKEKMMGIILEILGVLAIAAGCVVMSLDWRPPVGHKFLISGVLIFVVGRNSRRIRKLEKILKKEED